MIVRIGHDPFPNDGQGPWRVCPGGCMCWLIRGKREMCTLPDVPGAHLENTDQDWERGKKR